MDQATEIKAPPTRRALLFEGDRLVISKQAATVWMSRAIGDPFVLVVKDVQEHSRGKVLVMKVDKTDGSK